jgi:hypothetical protein
MPHRTLELFVKGRLDADVMAVAFKVDRCVDQLKILAKVPRQVLLSNACQSEHKHVP